MIGLEEARKKAKAYMKKHPDDEYAFRSCWNCNGAHEHLKDAKYPILCNTCAHWFWNGVDITIFDEEKKVAQ